MDKCPCGSGLEYNICCEPFINGTKKVETAEQLMRARYTAHVTVDVAFIMNSVLPLKKHEHSEKTVLNWASKTDWRGLDIVNVTDGSNSDESGQVEFVAHFLKDGMKRKHREIAKFKKEDDTWYFEDGEKVVSEQQQIVNSEPKAGRNDPCPCGSGRKFKKCCGK